MNSCDVSLVFNEALKCTPAGCSFRPDWMVSCDVHLVTAAVEKDAPKGTMVKFSVLRDLTEVNVCHQERER